MSSQQETIRTFYEAMGRRDFQTMQSLYHDRAVFYDPVFGHLNAEEVKAMWEMLLRRGKDLTIEIESLKDSKSRITAHYTFSKTGRKIANQISNQFRFLDGKIIEHIDDFSLYGWTRQAFGPIGMILGWTATFQRKVQNTAKQSLIKFMNKSND